MENKIQTDKKITWKIIFWSFILFLLIIFTIHPVISLLILGYIENSKILWNDPEKYVFLINLMKIFILFDFLIIWKILFNLKWKKIFWLFLINLSIFSLITLWWILISAFLLK